MSKPVAFQFSKSASKPKVIPTTLSQYQHDKPDVETEFVSTIDNEVIQSSKKTKLEPGPLVIPLKKAKVSVRESAASNKVERESGDGSLEHTAVQELLATAKSEDTADEDADGYVPLINTSGPSIGAASSLDDYTSVPVEKFGRALLRGMGLTSLPEPVDSEKPALPDVQPRPKGLGLGACPAAASSAATAQPAKDEEQLQMRSGAHVRVVSGRDKGSYGEVQSLDGDGRAVVRLTVQKTCVNLPELALQLVTKKEYKKCSRVLNQDKYLEHKAKQDLALSEHRAEASPLVVGDKRTSTQKSRPAAELPRSDAKPAAAADGRWVRAQLRVRCVDRKYAGGRYYKQKVTVVDVASSTACSCQTAEGRLLEDVPLTQLETVVPRTADALVMVVQGRQRGQLARMLQWDRKRCRAVVQTISDEQLLQLGYDEVCEFAGSEDDR